MCLGRFINFPYYLLSDKFVYQFLFTINSAFKTIKRKIEMDIEVLISSIYGSENDLIQEELIEDLIKTVN